MTNVVPLGRDSPLARLGARVLVGLPDLLPTMGAAYRGEIAEYAAMAPDDFDHVLSTSRAFIGRFAELLRDGIDRPLPDHARLKEAGRRRQADGISLDAAMHAFRLASRVGWTGIAAAAEDEDPTLVGELAGRWIEYADRAATAFAEGHATAATEQLRRVDARRQAVVTDLLAAEDAAAARAVASRHGLRLATHYAPVLFAEAMDLVDGVVSHLPSEALVGHRGARVIALVPVLDADAHPAGLAPLASSGLVVVGRPSTPGAALLAEVATVESTFTVAVDTGRQSGIVTPTDLLLERVVREHHDLEAHLASTVLAPLVAGDRDGIFRDTLRAWFASGSVPEVARQLIVHPNTVTYRLGRVRDLTGLDPRVPAEATTLTLALALEAATP